ncbi:Putative glutathione-S-transferase [Sorangium cellulosum So ce56]|uniref:Glutathione-S-transferase n=1 Tax=Sorangium cellulosum (strain So ce56) TaxID=448385 RepID=A9GC58_SORC5|nr:maleylacetoacetate isomerase [Sorangium cellulosum]CAN96142.1 Putative glutathione-S-transferase [Sorangium cellulosum So ce56]
MSAAVKGLALYGYWRSSCSWRVRIALAHKGVEHAYRPVNLVRDGGEQLRDEYRAKNPMAQVPLLEFEQDGAVRRVSQSVAIIELLEDLFPAPPLLPADPYLRARARQLVEMINSGTQPMQNTATLKYVRDELGGDEKAFGRRFITSGLAAFQAAASELAGRFCVGDQVTVADVFLVPQLYNARRYEVDLAPLSILTRIEAACMELPAFQAAHADRQVDAVA